MNERCATCRHWGAGIIDPALPLTRVITEPDRDGHKVCALTVTHGHSDGYKATDTTRMLAYADDYDGEPQGLWTRPEFWCVQWEQRG